MRDWVLESWDFSFKFSRTARENGSYKQVKPNFCSLFFAIAKVLSNFMNFSKLKSMKNSPKPKKVLFNLLYFHLFADSENFDVRKQKQKTKKRRKGLLNLH